MDEEKRKALESAGWRVGTVQEFLGLTEEENRIVEDTIRISAEDVPRATEADRERLRKAMEGPIDTSDSPEKKGAFNRIRRDASGRLPETE